MTIDDSAPTMWMADTDKWCVREIACPNGTHYPARDADGNTIFDNTHFGRQADARKQLRAEAEAEVKLADSAVKQAERALHSARLRAATADFILSRVLDDEREK